MKYFSLHNHQNPKQHVNGQYHREVLEFASILLIGTQFAFAAVVARRLSLVAQLLFDCCSANARRNARVIHQSTRLLSSCGVFSVKRNDGCLVGPAFTAGQNLPLIHSRATLLLWLAQILKIHLNESNSIISYFLHNPYLIRRPNMLFRIQQYSELYLLIILHSAYNNTAQYLLIILFMRFIVSYYYSLTDTLIITDMSLL